MEVQDDDARNYDMQIEEAMKSTPVRQALELGVDENKLRKIVLNRVLAGKEMYEAADALLRDYYRDETRDNSTETQSVDAKNVIQPTGTPSDGVENVIQSTENQSDKVEDFIQAMKSTPVLQALEKGFGESAVGNAVANRIGVGKGMYATTEDLLKDLLSAEKTEEAQPSKDVTKNSAHGWKRKVMDLLSDLSGFSEPNDCDSDLPRIWEPSNNNLGIATVNSYPTCIDTNCYRLRVQKEHLNLGWSVSSHTGEGIDLMKDEQEFSILEHQGNLSEKVDASGGSQSPREENYNKSTNNSIVSQYKEVMKSTPVRQALELGVDETKLRDIVLNRQLAGKEMHETVDDLLRDYYRDKKATTEQTSDNLMNIAQSLVIGVLPFMLHQGPSRVSENVKDPKKCYDMNHAHRGRALIFNHENFETDLNTRKGTEKDCASLHKTLQKLGFGVSIYKDYKFYEIMKNISEVASEDHTNNDCLSIVILSHGNKDGIYAYDGIYKLDQITSYLTAENCPTLAGKPKLFFIQACRGGNKEYRYFIDGNIEKDADSSFIKNVPDHADFLFMYSTIEDYVSYRSPEDGSWFIQALVAELNENATKFDILVVLTLVVKRVVNKGYDENLLYLQLPSITSRLTHSLRFTHKNAVK